MGKKQKKQKKEKKYRLGLKLQGDYKGKSLKGKVGEFVKTAGKQVAGTAKAASKAVAAKQKMQICAKKGGKWVKGKCISK